MSEKIKLYSKAVKVWLAIGLIMVAVQIFLGGVTRLTGSGLSITKWDIVTGTIPPLTQAEWEDAFDLYKQTPQYHKINSGMTLPDFKFIFFWEYTHRLWGRIMGFVFLIPFIVFWRRKEIDTPLMRRLVVVVLMAAVVASLGWIMVASGLINRPWVNAYKLAIHLSAALILFGYLLWTYYSVAIPNKRVIHNDVLKRWITIFMVIFFTQLFLGGMMSGMKAGIYFPTWPDMNGQFVPRVLLDSANWVSDNFVYYEQSPFMSGLVQFFHRLFAYLLIIIGLYVFFKGRNIKGTRFFTASLYLFVGMVNVQVLLGILTVMNSSGAIPLWLGVFHQLGAILLLTSFLLLKFQIRKT